MISSTTTVSRSDFRQGTGWDIKPEGACKGSVCIPLTAEAVEGDTVNLLAAAREMGLPLVHDESHDLWALGPEAIGSRALTTARAPELVLPDLDGNAFALSSLRGKKVVLVAWSPY